MTDLRGLKDEAEAARSLLANIRDIVQDDEQAAADAIEGETNLLEAIGAAVDAILEADAEAEALAGMVKRLAQRRERAEARADRIRAAIADAMAQTDLRKLKLPQATLTIKATPPKAIITDELDIPTKYLIEQPPKLDKRAVLEALKAGEQVPGAQLSNGGASLQIRI